MKKNKKISIMEKDKIYKGGCIIVYEQHADDCTSVEYSLDNGLSWHDVPVDMGKINYFSAWFRLKQ